MTLRSPLLALGVFALAACADPVAPRPTVANVPDGANPAVVVNSTDPVQFTLPAGPLCGLTTEVTGTGEFHTVIRVSQSKSGVWKVTFSQSAHGTASGADGSQYVFNYANAGEWVDPVDPNTLPPVIEIVDHFNLLGQGKTPDLKVYLRGKFNSTTFEPIDNPVVRGPDIFCDPI
jgi:hypothetical protein